MNAKLQDQISMLKEAGFSVKEVGAEEGIGAEDGETCLEWALVAESPYYWLPAGLYYDGAVWREEAGEEVDADKLARIARRSANAKSQLENDLDTPFEIVALVGGERRTITVMAARRDLGDGRVVFVHRAIEEVGKLCVSLPNGLVLHWSWSCSIGEALEAAQSTIAEVIRMKPEAFHKSEEELRTERAQSFSAAVDDDGPFCVVVSNKVVFRGEFDACNTQAKTLQAKGEKVLVRRRS